MVAKIKILFFIFILKINAYTRIDKDVYISNDACTGIYTLALMNETRAYQFIKYMEKWKFEDDEFYVNYKKYHSCEIIMWSSEVDYSNPIEVDDCHQRRKYLCQLRNLKSTFMVNSSSSTTTTSAATTENTSHILPCIQTPLKLEDFHDKKQNSSSFISIYLFIYAIILSFLYFISEY